MTSDLSGDRPRQRLNRDRVVDAAVSFADDHGYDALNMRDLAAELGVVPMAIYKHVANKEDLLDAMVDRLVSEIGDPPPNSLWLDSVRHLVLEARTVLQRHERWARQAIESRTRRTPTVLAHMDRLAGAFRSGGLSDDLTHHAMHALGNRMWGFSPEFFNPAHGQPATAPDPSLVAGTMSELADRFPNIYAITMRATAGDPALAESGCDEEFEFEFALDLLLDGVDRLRADGWARQQRRTAS